MYFSRLLKNPTPCFDGLSMSGSPPRFHGCFPLILNYYLRRSCRGAQISWSSFPQSSSGNPWFSAQPRPAWMPTSDTAEKRRLPFGPEPPPTFSGSHIERKEHKEMRRISISLRSLRSLRLIRFSANRSKGDFSAGLLGDCGHDGMQIWSLGCGHRPALGLSKGAETLFQQPASVVRQAEGRLLMPAKRCDRG